MTTSVDPAIKQAVHKNYLWFALGFFMPLFTLWGIYQLFSGRSATAGTWLQSHTDFQIRFVTVVMGGLALGLILHKVPVLPIFIFAAFWIFYMLRLARGWAALGQGEEAESGWV